MKTAHEEQRVQVFAREGCDACEALKAALRKAGIPFDDRRPAERHADLALARWYDLPDDAPQLVVDGEAVELDFSRADWTAEAVRRAVCALV